jgi:hypothetical protein
MEQHREAAERLGVVVERLDRRRCSRATTAPSPGPSPLQPRHSSISALRSPNRTARRARPGRRRPRALRQRTPKCSGWWYFWLVRRAGYCRHGNTGDGHGSPRRPPIRRRVPPGEGQRGGEVLLGGDLVGTGRPASDDDEAVQVGLARWARRRAAEGLYVHETGARLAAGLDHGPPGCPCSVATASVSVW